MVFVREEYFYAFSDNFGYSPLAQLVEWLQVQIPVWAQVVGSVPGWSVYLRQLIDDQCISLTKIFLSFPLLL